MKSRVLLVVSLVVLSAVAAQTINRGPTPEEGTDLASSSCFTCHAVGGGRLGPSLTQMYAFDVEVSNRTAVNLPIEVRMNITNQWTSELRNLSIEVELDDAGVLSFDARPDPILDRVNRTVLPAPAWTQLDQDREAWIEFVVPPGITEAIMTFTVLPSEGSVAPALNLELTDPVGEPKDNRTLSPGEAYSVRFEEGALPGSWRLQVRQDSFSSGLPEIDRSRLQEHILEVEVDSWFNYTSEQRTRTLLTPLRLDGQQPQSIQSWESEMTVFLVEEAPANLTLRSALVGYYEHPPNVRADDAWRYIQTQTISLGPQEVTNSTSDLVVVSRDSPFDWVGWSEVLGYSSGFLVLVSIVTGGMLGRWSKPALNRLLGSAKRRIIFHNVVSYLILILATGHSVIFLLEPLYHWSVGLLLGGIGVVALFSLGFTGALQTQMVRRWSFSVWRGWHWGSAWAVLVFTTLHMLLDGANFTHVAESVGWRDPVVERFGPPRARIDDGLGSPA